MREVSILAVVGLSCVASCGGIACGGSALSHPSASPPVEQRSSLMYGVEALSAEERLALGEGTRVSRPAAFELNGRSYIGGVSFQLVRAQPEEVWSTLRRFETLPQVLPRTKRATVVRASGRSSHVELQQGSSLIDATYTIVLVEEPELGRMRFRLDRSRPHDIQDVYGHFQIEPFDEQRSLITVAAVVDVGSGFVRMLFSESIQRIILSTPDRIRDYMEQAAPAVARRAAHPSPPHDRLEAKPAVQVAARSAP